MKSNEQLKKDIVQLVREEKGKPIPINIICNKLKNLYRNKYEIISEIDNLLKEEALKQLFNKKIVMGYENGPLLKDTAFEGVVSINAKGDGFVKKIDDESVEVYINKKNVNFALNGDKVLCCLMDKQQRNNSSLKDGVILKIIERNKDFFVGIYNTNKFGYQVTIDDEKNKLKVVLDDTDGLVDGHKILIKSKKIENGIIYGTVSRILGHANSVGVDILSIVCDAGLEPEFSDQVNNESKKFNKIIDQNERLKRVDLTNLDIVTIDPRTSKDLDDAIYVKKITSNLYKLYVCIADVAHYVKPNSLIDTTAFNRGTSVYLVNQVIPMLPHILSNDICSLNPHEERLSMVCEMDIDNLGNFQFINVYNAIINSKKRFAYEDVNDFFDKKDSLNTTPESIKKMLLEAKELFSILKNKREQLGYINFDIKEPKIILDENEKIIDIQIKKSGLAQNMIESFMVSANEAVTLFYAKQTHKPEQFIYRVHDKPNDKKIEVFQVEAKKMFFKIDNEIKDLKPNTISKWLKNNQNNPNMELINLILLRTMAKASYCTENIGHFGLALQNYTHFTSPIRRYSDLIIHRLFKMFVLNKNEYSEKEKSELINNLNEICKQTTKTEIVATDTEREVNSMKFAEFMEQKIGHVYNGFISYITSFGIFIQLDNTIEGLARIENIKGDFFEFDKENSTYIGKRTNKILTLGTKVKIKVIGSNKKTKKIDFEIISFN